MVQVALQIIDRVEAEELLELQVHLEHLVHQVVQEVMVPILTMTVLVQQHLLMELQVP